MVSQHWTEKIPKVKGSDGSVVTVWAGEFNGERGLTPPVNSYAASPDSDVAIFLIELPPGAKVTIPPAKLGAATNRMVYFVEGEHASIGQQSIASNHAATLRADLQAEIKNTHPSVKAEFLLLQGKPINEPVAQHGPFVMNTDAEIQQAFLDYRRTQFGGWPWHEDAVVFPRTKGRFSKQRNVEETPEER